MAAKYAILQSKLAFRTESEFFTPKPTVRHVPCPNFNVLQCLVRRSIKHFLWRNDVFLCCCDDGVRLSVELQPLTVPLSIPQMILEWIWSIGGMILTGENPIPVPLCSPYVLHGLRGSELRPPRWEASDYPPVLWHGGITSYFHWFGLLYVIQNCIMLSEVSGSHDGESDYVFWDTAPCSLAEIYRRFGGPSICWWWRK
jgi:hypothetical protein